MESTRAISVIIPAYNAGGFIDQAIRSVLEQSFRDFEVIVVNDGSSDDTPKIVASHVDPRIRLVNQENAGQSAACNRGLSEARGRFIKFFDGDDVLSSTHLASQVRSLEGTTAHISSCRWASFADDTSRPTPRGSSTDRDYEDPLAWILDSMEYDEGMMPGWRWLIPRTVLERAGGWDERLSVNNDFEFSIRLLVHSAGVKFVGDALVFYRQGLPGSLSKTTSRPAMESAWLTTRLGCDQILERDDSPRARRLCADRMQDWLFRFYPGFPDLAAKAARDIQSLGGSSRPLEGGTVLRLLSRVLHWKQIRFLQHCAYSHGWDRVLRWKASRKNPALQSVH